MKAVVIWLVAAMQAWVPVPKQADTESDAAYAARNGESYQATSTRRNEFAEAIYTVAYDPKEKALFTGSNGRALTAMFLNAIASYEGGYHRLVHSGVWRGDHGRSWCQMQLNIGEGKTSEGWTGKELIKDPVKCVRAGLHVLQESVRVCTSAPHNFTWEKDKSDVFSAYMSGSCFKGNIHAKHRWDRAMDYFKAKAPPSD